MEKKAFYEFYKPTDRLAEFVTHKQGRILSNLVGVGKLGTVGGGSDEGVQPSNKAETSTLKTRQIYVCD